MKVSIRYCAMCGYEPQVLELTRLLLSGFKRRVTDLTLIPDSGGTFEVSMGGDLVYSKLATDEFPDNAAMLDEFTRRLKAK